MRRTVMGIAIGAMLVANTAAVFAEGRIARREIHQQQRIGNGIKNGTLKPGQAAHIEHQEANLNHEVSADRAANGGKLTGQERQQVNQQQNNLSREIYDDKHF